MKNKQCKHGVPVMQECEPCVDQAIDDQIDQLREEENG